MKVQLEERLKHALQYNLDFESPLAHVHRFFSNTFSMKQMRNNSSLDRWRTETELLIQNTSFIPLSLSFHPVLIAATFLAWTREQMLQTDSKTGVKPTHLPELIHDHPWFLYVDPGITAWDLNQLV